MSPRNTRTGGVLEQMVLPALDQGEYSYKVQVNLGQRLGCGRHFVDAVAEKNGRSFLISVKWQQVAGTAEQKVPFEIICLAEALTDGRFEKAYLVLGGEGWTLRDFYTTGGLNKYLAHAEKVEVVGGVRNFVCEAFL